MEGYQIARQVKGTMFNNHSKNHLLEGSGYSKPFFSSVKDPSPAQSLVEERKTPSTNMGFKIPTKSLSQTELEEQRKKCNAQT